ARPRTLHALAAEPELLPPLRARRDPRADESVDRGNVDLRARVRLLDRDGNDAVDVVAQPLEIGVRGDAHGDEEVARLPAAAPLGAFSRHADRSPVLRPFRDADLDRLRFGDASHAPADRTDLPP